MVNRTKINQLESIKKIVMDFITDENDSGNRLLTPKEAVKYLGISYS